MVSTARKHQESPLSHLSPEPAVPQFYSDPTSLVPLAHTFPPLANLFEQDFLYN